MYEVIKYFTDLQDNGFAYYEGDTYPRKGKEVLPSRLKELSTTANRRNEPLIKKIDTDDKKSKK